LSASHMMSVRPSVCLFVTLLERGHIVHQKVEMGTLQNRSVFWLPPCTVKLAFHDADTDTDILARIVLGWVTVFGRVYHLGM